MAHSRGLFITLEGGEGAGKSTQAALLRRRLEARGYGVILTREPGGTRVGEAIRNLLLDPSQEELAPVAETLLYAASRAQLVGEVIVPALAAGRMVVCDRFVDSSLAYQGHGLGVGIRQVRAINRAATGGLSPDLTIYFDRPPEVGLAAARARGAGVDRIEGRDAAYHARVRAAYLRLARAEPDRIRVVAADRPVQAVAEEVWDHVERALAAQREV